MIEQKYIDRFHTKYVMEPLTGCWLWTDVVARDGYGIFGIKSDDKFKLIKSHRFSAMVHGLDMSKPVVRHICHNRICVNPAHLETGTRQENMDDMTRAGRQNRGITVNTAKLTEQQILEIRAKYIPKIYTLKMLAEEYNVNLTTISEIIKRTTWKHI